MIYAPYMGSVLIRVGTQELVVKASVDINSM